MTSPIRSQSLPAGLADRLASGQFVLTAEITPPVSGDAERLIDIALPFRGLADAVNLTDGAGARSHMCALASAALLLSQGIEPIMQITCRDRNRIAIQGDIMGAAALGIRNVLVMTGDDPKAGDQPETKPVFDLDSGRLIAMLRDMRDAGLLPTGRAVSGLDGLLIGAADMPIDPPADWLPKGLAAKLEAGARFAQTQFCMDTAVLRRYVARLAEHGLTDRIKLIVGVVPLRNARSGRWIRDNLYGSIIPDAHIARMEAAGDADAAAEGVRICMETIEEMKTIPGVAGAHIMAPRNEAAAIAVLKAIRGPSSSA